MTENITDHPMRRCTDSDDTKEPIIAPPKEQWHIFTFGSGQDHEGFYVKIWGTFESARAKMIEKYAYSRAFQYTEEQWMEWIKEKPKWLPVEQLLETIE